jgi:hypothetical protein
MAVEAISPSLKEECEDVAEEKKENAEKRKRHMKMYNVKYIPSLKEECEDVAEEKKENAEKRKRQMKMYNEITIEKKIGGKEESRSDQ